MRIGCCLCNHSMNLSMAFLQDEKLHGMVFICGLCGPQVQGKKITIKIEEGGKGGTMVDKSEEVE